MLPWTAIFKTLNEGPDYESTDIFSQEAILEQLNEPYKQI